MKTKTKKGRLSKIPVLEVSRKNIDSVWPYLLVSVKSCDFLSIDLEFTGLGEKKQIFGKSVEERYLGAKYAAESRCVLAIGISTFKVKENEANGSKRLRIVAKVFNILTISDQEFTCEPSSLAYLARNSFDFCEVFTEGIVYNKDWSKDSKKSQSPIEVLMSEIFTSEKPILVHNGLLDTVFMYGNFYSSLPSSSGEFLSRLSETLGRGGIYDSKYLTEFHLRLPASYLEYVFRYCQRANAKEAESQRVYLSLEFDADVGLHEEYVSVIDCPLPRKGSWIFGIEEKSLCISMANHGFCSKEQKCTKSHDLDEILDCTEAKKEKKRQKSRKRRLGEEGVLSCDSNSGLTVERNACSLREGIAGTSRAGFDSFMTGFAVAFGGRMSLLKNGILPDDLRNCLYLSGKDFPLRVQCSNFVEKSS